MSMDSNRWINTLPFSNKESNQEKYKLDSSRWINTLPKKDDDILILSSTINSNSSPKSNPNPKSNSVKKYSLTIIGFVIGLILISAIKNATRNLQKEISNLHASINTLKLDLHQTTLEYDVITSPENISRLANEYLESGFVSYEKSQIKQLNEKVKILVKSEEKKDRKTFEKKSKMKTDEIKLQVAAKIKATKTELKKLKEIYSKPEQIPNVLRYKVAKKIDIKKTELEKLYSNPYDVIKTKKAQKWVGLQAVKLFLGMPIVPGR